MVESLTPVALYAFADLVPFLLKLDPLISVTDVDGLPKGGFFVRRSTMQVQRVGSARSHSFEAILMSTHLLFAQEIKTQPGRFKV